MRRFGRVGCGVGGERACGVDYGGRIFIGVRRRFPAIARVFFWGVGELAVDCGEGVGGCRSVIWVEHCVASGAHEFKEVFHPSRLG